MTNRTRIAVLTLALLPLAGCGSSGGGSGSASSGSGTTVSAKTYVHDICGAISNALQQVRTENTQLQSKVQADEKKGLPAIKQDAISYFDDVTSKVQQMRDGIDHAGTPDVSNGASVRSHLLSGIDTALSTMHSVQSDIRNLSSSNAQQFASKMTSEAQRVQQVFGNVGTSMSQISSPALDQAAKSDKTCTSLSAAG